MGKQMRLLPFKFTFNEGSKSTCTSVNLGIYKHIGQLAHQSHSLLTALIMQAKPIFDETGYIIRAIKNFRLLRENGGGEQSDRGGRESDCFNT